MRTGFPKRYGADDTPAHVRELVGRLVPALIQGQHPALAAVRDQFSCASIDSVEFSGVGFFVEFVVPIEAPVADPPDFAGGNADISVEGLHHGAGCVLFVRAGKLAMFEAYSNGGEPWPENARILKVDNVFPVNPNAAG